MIAQNVITHLLAEPQVVAQLGQRITPDTIPQGSAKPCAAVTEIVTTVVNTLCGYAGKRNARVQVDVYGVKTSTKGGAQMVSAAADAIEARMRVAAPQFTSLLLSRVGGYDDAVQEHHVRMDFSLWSKS
jgi:hypothetical protein